MQLCHSGSLVQLHATIEFAYARQHNMPWTIVVPHVLVDSNALRGHARIKVTQLAEKHTTAIGFVTTIHVLIRTPYKVHCQPLWEQHPQ